MNDPILGDMRARAAAIALLGAVSGISWVAPSAAAQAPACEEVADAFELPPKVAFGRDLKILLKANESAQVSAADPTRPYQSPTRREPFKDGTRLIIPIRSNDGPVRIDLFADRTPEPCLHQVSYVAPVAGVLPRLTVKDDVISGAGGSTYPGIYFRLRTPSNCFEGTPGRVTLTFRDGRRFRTASVQDACLWDFDVTRIRAPGFDFGTTQDRVNDDSFYPPSLTPQWRGGSEHTLRYSLALAGRPLRSGTLHINMAGGRPIYIYAGTDEFQNYCINRSKTIYRKNGRRYCLRIFNDDGAAEWYVDHRTDKRAKALR